MKSFPFFLLIAAAGSLNGLPSGMQVIAGSAEISASEANQLLIQSGDHTILQWDQFSIGQNEIAQFMQSGGNSALLNRVMGGSVSEILGLMESNGKLYLINPNGVLIGPDARIESAGFLASTLDVLDEDFLSKQELLFAGDSNGAILNLGTISCPRGDVALFARFVKNEGDIQAQGGSALLASAPEILLKLEGKQQIYIRPDLVDSPSKEDGIFPLENTGTIEALSVELQSGASPYLQAIRGAGSIKGVGTTEENGIVYLVAHQGYTEMSGTMAAKRGDQGGEVRILGDKVSILEGSKIDAAGDAGGGNVFIGGSFQGKDSSIKAAKVTLVYEGVEIAADALASGDGGQVVLWSNNTTGFYGSITAHGGPFGGDGGTVEVSGPHLFYSGKSSTLAAHGKIGTLLLDPNDITISLASTTSPSIWLGQGGLPAHTVYFDGFDSDTSPANLNNVNLVTALNSTNVIIQTDDSFMGGSGNITISADIGDLANPWTAATQLTLRATAQILITTPGIQIANTFSGDNFTAMYFIAGQGNGVPTGTAGAGIVIEDASLLTDSGDIFLTGTGGHNGDNNYGVLIFANTMSAQVATGTSGGGGSITINGRATADITGAVNNNSGVSLQSNGLEVAVVSVASGNISIFGNCQNSSTSMGTNNTGVSMGTFCEVLSEGINPLSQILIEGIGGPGNASLNDGIQITGAEAFVGSNAGSITMVGMANGASTNNNGININTGPTITTAATTNTASITLIGSGSNMTPSSGSGIQIIDSSIIATAAANIVMSGTGGNDGSGNNGIAVTVAAATTTIETNTGSITMTGNAVPTTNSAMSNNSGVLIQGTAATAATVFTSSGELTITGSCQNTSASMMSANVGVLISTNAQVESVGTDPTSQIVITGIGGPGTSGNHGIEITGTGTFVSTEVGGISLIGTGNGNLTGASTLSDGVLISNGANVKSFTDDDTGAIVTLSGNVQGDSSGSGVLIQDATVTTIGSNLFINGVGGSTGNNNVGVEILADTAATTVSAFTGSVSINGKATPDITFVGSNNTGVAIHGTVGSLVTVGGGGDGDLTIVGNCQAMVAMSMSNNNIGVLIDQNGVVSNTSLMSPDSLILIKGTGGPGQAGTPTLNNGIQISNSSSVIASGGGISLIGIGNGVGTNNYGIFINNGTVQSTANASGQTVSLEGTGSNGVNGTAPTDFNCGVSLQAAAYPEGVSSVNSNISIVGTASNNATGTDNHGIFIGSTSPASTVSSVVSTGTGNISLTGYGGASGTPNCSGVTVQFTPGMATPSFLLTVTGNIAIHGESSGLGFNPGILLTNTASITSITGDIVLSGLASGTGGSNHGILINDSAIISSDLTGQGLISLTGQGSLLDTSGGDNGVYFTLTTNNPVVTPGFLQTFGHDIVITGLGGGTGPSAGFSTGIELLNNVAVSGPVLTIGVPSGMTGSGSITLNGTGANSGTSGNHGIVMSGGDSQVLVNLDTGDLYMTGIGGNTSNGGSDGMEIINSTTIQSVSGNMVFYGESLASGSTSRGCLIANSTIKSTSTTGIPGILSITGFGSINSTNGTGNHGVYLTFGTMISSMQHDMYITGAGGGDTGGAAANNIGFLMDQGANIVSTDLTTSAASLYIEGTGGLGGAGSNIGVQLVGTTAPTFISITDGDIFITAKGNGNGSNSHGLQLLCEGNMAPYISTTGGMGINQIYITGVGSDFGASSNSIGVYLLGPQVVTGPYPLISSVSGPVTIVAESGPNGGSTTAFLIDNGEISMPQNGALTIQTLSNGGAGGDLFLQNVTNVVAASGGTSTILANVARDFKMINGGGMSANSLNVQTGRDLIIQADTSGAPFSSTGVSGLQSDLTNSSANPITVELIVGRNLTLTGGTSMGQGAIILSPAGDAVITVGGGLTIQAGSGANAFAQIGGFVGSGNLLFPVIGGDVTINGGSGGGGSWGSIGYGNGIASFSGANVTGTITFLEIDGNITLQGGPTIGFAQIGHINPPSGTAFDISGNIFINATGSITFNPAGTSVGTYAQIGHGGPNPGVATFTGASAVQVFAGTTINMAGMGGQAIFVNPSTNALATFPHSGSITLVADNQNPLNPYVGGTSFSMNNTSSITNNAASGGQVRIYTSVQDTVAGIQPGQMINGMSYVPTPPGSNTNTEMFNDYYGTGPFFGPQFVIYYKFPTMVICPMCPICPVCPTCPNCTPTTKKVFFPEMYIIAVATAQLTDLLPVMAAADHQGQLCSTGVMGGLTPGEAGCSPGFTRFESFIFENTVDRMLPKPED